MDNPASPEIFASLILQIMSFPKSEGHLDKHIKASCFLTQSVVRLSYQHITEKLVTVLDSLCSFGANDLDLILLTN